MIRIEKKDRSLEGVIKLDGSKSISNRILIISALAQAKWDIIGLSTSKDTSTLKELLLKVGDNALLDCGPAGTTFRFLTAYLCTQEGTQFLTGSERMKERPIGELVNALRYLGADIEYLAKEGYPPLKIGHSKLDGHSKLSIRADISSQYLSAILMIAPYLSNGISIELLGKIVSKPYLDMTLALMEYFGIHYAWDKNTISIEPQQYVPRKIKVEADWSAASYFYSMATLCENVDLKLEGLFENSVQGDAVLKEVYADFGIDSEFVENGIMLKRSNRKNKYFHFDFIECPDIAQTLAVTCAATGIQGRFKGIETLRIKETDRVKALKIELNKLNVEVAEISAKGEESFAVKGWANAEDQIINTYHDHRMAMSFAPLALLGPIRIENPSVVEKSYPKFWSDLQEIGFKISKAS